MQNLRDKLLKAGVVDKKAKKKADHEERKRRTKDRRKAKPKDEDEAARQAAFERRQADHREQDRQREDRRKAEQQAQADRQAREHAEAESAQREAQRKLREISRARDLVQASLITPKAPGPVRFNFVSRSGAIRHMDLSTREVHELDRGQLAIAQLPGRDRWGLIRRDVAEQVLEVEPALVRFFAPDGREPLEPVIIEDQPATKQADGKASSVFSSQRDRSGGRRDR